MVSFCKKLVHQNPSGYHDVPLDPSEAEALMEAIRRFKAEYPHPSLREALDFALEIEANGAENLHRTLMTESNPQIQKLISNLATEDSRHAKLLADFALAHMENA